MVTDEKSIRTWMEWNGHVGRLLLDLPALVEKARLQGVPERAYYTFSESGAEYRVSARWTVD